MTLVIWVVMTGFLLWLLLRLLVRKSLRAETARLRAKIETLQLKAETEQTTLTPFMYDSYPYERHWKPDPELELYGESTAELDLEDAGD